MLKWFLLWQKRWNYRFSSNASRILLKRLFRSTCWPDDHFNMNNCGGNRSAMACSTQGSHNQSCWSDFICSRSAEVMVTPAMHWEFYSLNHSEAPTDQTITSTWTIGVGLSRQCPVPHKKPIISHVEVISFVAEAPKLWLIQQCIENFTLMAIPKHLLTRWSLQQEQLEWD